MTDAISRCVLCFWLMEISGKSLWSLELGSEVPVPGREIAVIVVVVVDEPHWPGLILGQMCRSLSVSVALGLGCLGWTCQALRGVGCEPVLQCALVALWEVDYFFW